MEILTSVAVILLAIASTINSVLSMKATRRHTELEARVRLLEQRDSRDDSGFVDPGLNSIGNGGVTYRFKSPETLSADSFLQQLRDSRRARRHE